MFDILELVGRVDHLRDLELTGVSVAANWLSRRVISLKQQIHPAWEYSGTSDPTREVETEIPLPVMTRCLHELFQDHSTWQVSDTVKIYSLNLPRDSVSTRHTSLHIPNDSDLTLHILCRL